ncbi:MAG: PQQ-binding-like beta-propeller repeat protein [Phycisphaerales bacterium]|nr:MAG: PQQ-binding-like beta-propeller repeat protein [Phycisphaerales bacterium]
MNRASVLLAIVFAVIAVCSPAPAEDWPTYGHDNYRSGITGEQLGPPLRQSWVFKAQREPEPAWPPPAEQDFFHSLSNLRPTVTYDRAFHVVGAGDALYFGSSADDKIYCLDAETGRVRWNFYTEGPVRFAPTVAGDRVYAGSDDGRVYCLGADDGSLVWKYEVAEKSRVIPGNGRMISMWPVRTGLVVEQGNVYCAAGLFPLQGTYLCSLAAVDGSVKWHRRIDVSPQGYMMASEDRLYVPTGRTNPVIFARGDGSRQGELPSAGGSYALLTKDVVITGPGRGAHQLSAGDIKTKDAFATFGGLRMLVNGPVAYMQSEHTLSALNRPEYLRLSRKRTDLSRQSDAIKKERDKLPKDSEKSAELQKRLRELSSQIARLSKGLQDCYLWTVDSKHSHSLIMAGDVIFAGGDNRVAALEPSSGKVIWDAPVAGKAYGLTVANGALIVSTDKGRIHCFRKNVPGDQVTAAQSNTDPYPRDHMTQLYARAAEQIVKQTQVTKGYCLVLGCGRGRLACELARRTDLKVIGLVDDIEEAAVARNAIDEAGLYGRVVIHHAGGDRLPYTRFFANLMVSDEALRTGKLPPASGHVTELLRPYGGVIAFAQPAGGFRQGQLQKWGQALTGDWNIHRRDKLVLAWAKRGGLKGAGEWTHWLAEPGNSACSEDELAQGEMAVQWFGQPGPRRMIDRHHRNVPPLVKDGRLFVPGDSVVFAVDAYNGTVEWQVDIPHSRRLGVFLDCGSMAVDEKLLYVVAEDKCHGFDVRTGRRQLSHKVPQLIEGEPRHWGYIAYRDNILFASACRKGASYAETSYDADLALWYRDMKLVTSDYLFALGKDAGELLWTYKDALILNTTITVGDGRLYFLETNSPRALADELGRMPATVLFDGGRQHLVALDTQTGRILYKRQIDVSNFEEPVYLNYARGILLLSGSRLIENSVRYYYQAFDAGSGELRWTAEHDTGLATDGAHGEYNRHPTIVETTVYAWPYAYDLRSGKRIEGWKFDRHGHGCGGISASAQSLFWRGGNPWMYDLGPDGGPKPLNRVTRPGCWINIIPAGGLVLVPEASSGCTCGFPLQTSMAFLPTAGPSGR